MTKEIRPIACCVFALSLLLVASCVDFRSANDAAVERLRQRLLHEEFDEIYYGASRITQAQLSRKEFVLRLKATAQILKAIDSELKWRRDERGSPERAVYREDNWSALILEKNGKRTDINLDWGDGFRLCGMLISGEVPEGGVRVFRNCD